MTRPLLILFCAAWVLALASCGDDPKVVEKGPAGDDTTGGTGIIDPSDTTDTGADDTGDDTGPTDSTGEDTGPPPDCTTAADCDDGNPCNTFTCEEGACAKSYTTATCDDDDPCTENDTCDGGQCLGDLVTCDDQNACTQDFCINKECKHQFIDEPQCQLAMTITSPQRGATLTGDKKVTVTGTITSGGSAAPTVTVNGAAVTPDAQGAFETSVQAEVGVNLLEVIGKDEFGQKERVFQAFLYGHAFHAAGTPGDLTMLGGSGGFWLDDQVFDDNDTGDLDDLATMVTMLLEGFDIGAVLPNPLFPPGQEPGGICKYKVVVSDVSYTIGKVDIKPTAPGQSLSAVLKNFKAWVDASGPCPDAAGWISASTISLDADVVVNVTEGAIDTQLDSVEVTISKLDVEVVEGLVSVLNFAINWFEGKLAAKVESELEAWIPTNLVPLINGMLADIADYTLDFYLPALGQKTEKTYVQIRVAPNSAAFSSAGVELAANVGVGAPKNNTHESPGSLQRLACGQAPLEGGDDSCVGNCGGQAPGGCWCDNSCAALGDCCVDLGPACGGLTDSPLPKLAAVESYLSSDLVNQLLHALWRGGQLNTTLTEADLGDALSEFGGQGLVMDIDPLLPPIVLTSCDPAGATEIQLGDAFAHLDFSLNGQATQIDLYGTFKIQIALKLQKGANGFNTLGVDVLGVTAVGADVVKSSSAIPAIDALVESLLTKNVAELFVKDMIAGLGAAYPIPTIDAGALLPGIPPGTLVTFEPTSKKVIDGNIVLSGAVVAP